MINFGDTIIKRITDNVIVFSAETMIDYSNSDNEAISFGTPKFWDDVILDTIVKNNKLYAIFMKVVPRSNCNSLTDYKKIWGLLGIPKGLYCNQYDCEDNRLYYGMSSITEGQFYSSLANVFLIIPQEVNLSPERVWETFCKSLNGDIDKSLYSFTQKAIGTVALRYICLPNAELRIIGYEASTIEEKIKEYSHLRENMIHNRFW